MGKGTIISEIGDGRYQIQLNLHCVRINARIAELTSQISDLTAYIATLPAGSAKTQAKLLLTSYQKKKEYLEDSMPDDIKLNAWCADKTEGLTGEVGTIEIPGERGEINIQPGYDGNAAYDIDRDGQLQPAIAGSPFNTLYNWMLLPGWQKWKPTYRYGTISNLDGDTCTVTLDDAESSQQGLNINRDSVLNNVPIEYMTCNGSAFTDGDEVIVKFVGQDPDTPKVIGFKEDPSACYLWYEPWGDTITDNHPWAYSFMQQSPFSMCYTLGCGGEASLSDGVVNFNYLCDGNGEAISLHCNSTLFGGSEDPIVGATKMVWKMNGGLSNKAPYSQITFFIRFYDSLDNYTGRIELFLDAGSGWYTDAWFTDPCGSGGSGPNSPAYDISGSSPMNGTEFEFDLTSVCTYDVKIGQVRLAISFDNPGCSVNLDFDYLYFQ